MQKHNLWGFPYESPNTFISQLFKRHSVQIHLSIFPPSLYPEINAKLVCLTESY